MVVRRRRVLVDRHHDAREGGVDPDVEALDAHDCIADAARAPSAKERRAIFQKAEEMLLDEMPVLPIYFYTARYLIDPRVREWHPTILNHHPYKHVYLAPAD